MDQIIGRSDPDEALRTLERSLGLWITIHDLTGMLRRDGRDILSSRRRSHQHPICRIPRGEQCLDHCYNAVHRELLAQGAAGCHHCWRGLCEIAVPLFLNGSHVATLFAGPWRSGDAPPASMPRRHRKDWHRLPDYPAQEAARIASLLELVGHGLLRSCEAPARQDEEPRRQIIDRWLHAHCHEAIHLADLAEHLHLSPSRCGHVVGECYNQTFPALLRHHRLQRARSLLAETALPMRAIAERVGMPAEAHFHRAFKAATGFTPRAWRMACHANRGRRWPKERPRN